MTARQIFEASLIECSKVNAPSLLLDEYNYYINKAINNYINKQYNIYDVNLLTTDDLRVLKSTTILPAVHVEETGMAPTSRLGSKYYNHKGIYEVYLPQDYLHLLNCICYYKVNKNSGCREGGSIAEIPAKRLTADSWSTIVQDYYNRPTPQRPYYYIHNINLNLNVPTNPVSWLDNEYVSGTDMTGIYDVRQTGHNGNSESDYDITENKGSNFARVITLPNSNVNISTVERATGHRYGNASPVRCEIRYGGDNTVFELIEVKIDYIKTPQTIRLTQEQMDITEDTSQIMEYPDYVCQEIINELTTLIMARTADPLLSNFVQVKLTIANPAQLQTQPLQTAASQS